MTSIVFHVDEPRTEYTPAFPRSIDVISAYIGFTEFRVISIPRVRVCTSVHVRTRKIYINAKLILGEIKRPARFRALLQRRFSNVLSFDYACRCCIMKRLSFVVARLIGYYYCYYFRKYSSFSTLHFCSISLGHRFRWEGYNGDTRWNRVYKYPP